ncbi:hypothetical protein CSAL01_10604 [Colletotrichum salicis]|uniref:Uncharacterized protein n=1 Tax=Colletotrichum salicis TaxID=1209931 RepID=A0A135UR49_9PEZI|nr:hypothetical protein CSAL01_10604 [Colletotrichum salicis]
MKSSTTLLSLTATLAAAVDMTPYKPSAGVDVAFADFVSEYYRTSEDKAATTTFTNFWPADGRMILAGRTFSGSTAMLGVKQSLLPPTGNKSWWHLIRGATVGGETETDKTFVAEIVVQTTGSAAFTVLKDAQGTPRLEPHSESLSVYNLTVSTTDSPTDIPCSSS